MINILYEDNHLLVVEKPVNMLSQSDITGDEDLLSLLKEDLKKRYNKPGQAYLGLVHRLDRPVGGVMVFAKTSKAASRLSEQIRNRSFEKNYLAVVHGKPRNPKDILLHYLMKDEKRNKVYVVKNNKDISMRNFGINNNMHPIYNSGGGKPKEALLEYEVLETREDLSLVQIKLFTGRPHQIRVQFAAVGNPLYGDKKYSERFCKNGEQLALWSNKIAFEHPVKKEKVEFSSSPPNIYPWNIFMEVKHVTKEMKN